VNLVKPITKIYSQGFYRNVFRIFQSLIVFSKYFRSLYEFLEFLKENGKQKITTHNTGPAFAPRLRFVGQAQLWNRPNALALCEVTAHGSRGQWCSGALAAALRRQASGKVFPSSMWGRSGWRWASPWGRGLTEVAGHR
jgi:hypothetical protein